MQGITSVDVKTERQEDEIGAVSDIFFNIFFYLHVILNTHHQKFVTVVCSFFHIIDR